MRIGLVVTGGVDRTGHDHVVPILLWLIERLARRHDVHVFALHYYRDACTYPLLGATVHDLGRVDRPPGLRRFRLQSRLAAALASLPAFDVLHAYWGMPAGYVTTHVARRIGVPAVVSLGSGELVACDDIDYGSQRRWIDRRAIARTLRSAARVTVETAYMARMPALGGARVDIVPMGVDPRTFPLQTRAQGPPWRLLRVGSLNRVKDYPTLLRAFRQIVDRLPNVHLDIVGEDTLDGSIQALSRTLGVDSKVTFHGFQPTGQLAAFYARAHLHLVSSRHEAGSVATLEAACAGVPTVGTAVGYVADWTSLDLARDRPAAVAVPVGDPAALAIAVVELLQDGARRDRLAAAARTWALAHNADWTAQQFERIYTEEERAAR